jgi:hypothetical protein
VTACKGSHDANHIHAFLLVYRPFAKLDWKASPETTSYDADHAKQTEFVAVEDMYVFKAP